MARGEWFKTKLRKRGGALCGVCAEETPEKQALTLGLGADSPGPAAPSPPSPQPAAAASRTPSPAPPAAAGSPCLQGAGGKDRRGSMVPAPRLPGRSLLALTSPSARGLTRSCPSENSRDFPENHLLAPSPDLEEGLPGLSGGHQPPSSHPPPPEQGSWGAAFPPGFSVLRAGLELCPGDSVPHRRAPSRVSPLLSGLHCPDHPTTRTQPAALEP